MKTLNYSAAALSVTLAVSPMSGVVLAANVDSANQQIEQVNSKRDLLSKPAVDAIPSLYKGESEDVGPQVRLGALQKPKHTWFDASIDSQILYTSNATLAEKAKTETSLLVTTAQLAITPPSTEIADGTLSLKGGYRHQKFNYGVAVSHSREFATSGVNTLDFDVSTFFVQGRYTFNENWVASAGVDYNRLLNINNNGKDEFYAEVLPKVGLERRFKIDDKSSVSVAGSVGAHFTSVDQTSEGQDRVDEAIMASYIRELLPDVVVQPYYRIQFTEYTNNRNRTQNRNDFIQSLGVGVAYSVCKNATLRATASFEQRDCSENKPGTGVPDYQKFDAGIGVTLNYRF